MPFPSFPKDQIPAGRIGDEKIIESFVGGRFKMVIKCTLSVSLKNIGVYTGRLSGLPPLPGYITKRGPFIQGGAEGNDRIITIYEFDRSKLEDARGIISSQLDAFQDIPGFTFSAQDSMLLAKAEHK